MSGDARRGVASVLLQLVCWHRLVQFASCGRPLGNVEVLPAADFFGGTGVKLVVWMDFEAAASGPRL